MPARQELRATLVLPEGLTQEQVNRLKKAFKAEMIATLGGAEFLRGKNITVIFKPQIPTRINLG